MPLFIWAGNGHGLFVPKSRFATSPINKRSSSKILPSGASVHWSVRTIYIYIKKRPRCYLSPFPVSMLLGTFRMVSRPFFLPDKSIDFKPRIVPCRCNLGLSCISAKRLNPGKCPTGLFQHERALRSSWL